MKRILITLAAALAMAFSVMAPAQAAPATVNNYCAQPYYAPYGTNGPVGMWNQYGTYYRVPCGQGKGSIYVVYAIYWTMMRESSGRTVCLAPGVQTPVYSSLARVWTTSWCTGPIIWS